jgi:hypothetical protein
LAFLTEGKTDFAGQIPNLINRGTDTVNIIDELDACAEDLTYNADCVFARARDEIVKLRAALAPFNAFLETALEDFTPGYEDRVRQDRPVFALNRAHLTWADFLAARAALKA